MARPGKPIGIARSVCVRISGFISQASAEASTALWFLCGRREGLGVAQALRILCCLLGYSSTCGLSTKAAPI